MMHLTQPRWNSFIGILITLTVLRVLFIKLQIWPINGDETQYWDWAKHLALGYYSKPPMLAWLIAISSKLLGDGSVGLRIISPLAHGVTAYFCYLIGRKLYDETVGFWSGLTYLLLPGVSFSATLVSTDPPLLMFWSMAFYCFISAISEKSTKWWVLTGISLGCAFLTKYTAIFFVISLLLYFSKQGGIKNSVDRKYIYLLLGIAILLLLPNLNWNLQHHFVSLLAVKDNANLARGISFSIKNMLDFLLAQFAIFGPALFVTFLWMLGKWYKVFQDERLQLLLIFAFPIFLVMVFESILSRANGNWAAPMYVTASVAVTAFLIKRGYLQLLKLALLFHFLLVLGFFFVRPLIHVSGIKVHRSTSTLNWDVIGSRIAVLSYEYPMAGIIVDDRMLLTKVMYHAKNPLDKTFKWNPDHALSDHYDLVTHLEKQQGASFLWVSYNKPDAISEHFKSSTHVETITAPTLDGRSINIYVYYLQGFLGYSVSKSEIERVGLNG